jgi:large subunit ribosomal protein L15
MPLMRRIPKRGFNSLFRNAYQIVNVGSLNRFEANSSVGPEELKRAGLIGSVSESIKILGDGKLEKPLTIKAHKFSGSAMKLIEAAGAKIELLKA